MPFDRAVHIAKGPPDIADWPETATITRVEFRPDNFLVRHSKEGTRPDSWPGAHVPGWGDGGADPGDIQWTLYIVIIAADGQWLTGPTILYYPEGVPSLGVNRGGAAPFSDAARNWWYQNPGMAGRQPGPGQRIGVLAVAGALRELDVRAVSERSNIAWVTVPDNDLGVYDFPVAQAAPPPPPPPPSEPQPQPLPLPRPAPEGIDSRLLANMEDLTSGLAMACQGLLRAAGALQHALERRR